MKVLVTGASGGIGSAVCRKYLTEGHTVVGMDVKPGIINDEHYMHVVHDIRNRDYPDVDGVEIFVNCAGCQEMNEEDIAVNLTASIAVCEHYADQGHIRSVLNVASASGVTGSEFPHYAASKGGMIAYTKNLALRLAKYKATANSICPGGVITDLNRHILDDEKLYRAVLDESLLGRWAEPEEMAEWAYFLTCVNRSMTGEALLIDNGEALKSNFIW
ncbi:MAG: SDR family oxidoreductase [Parasporobacterium sp.]|nr:SDR family oxidoreductase [Parasporobacterium sp.]